jgi:DNA-binding GntR family transcriptional regulator
MMNSKSEGPFARTLFARDILSRLRMDIILGTLTPGTRIVEAQLAKDMGVSRGPIRTSLQMLEQEGLVESLSNGGTKIVGFTLKNAADMYDFRAYIETKALQIALDNPHTNFHPLLNAVDLLTDIYKKETIDNFTQTITSVDIQYHRSILIISDNQPMLHAWNTMANVLSTILTITNTKYDNYYDYYILHKEIADLIIQRNPLCVEKIREHIMSSKETLIERLKEIIRNKSIV